MKNLYLLFLATLLFVGCSQKSNDGKVDAEMTFKSLTYAYDEGKVNVEIDVNYPEGGDTILRNALCEYISEALGGTYEGDLADGQKMIDFYGNLFKAELIKEYDELRSCLDEENINGLYRKFVIEKEYETDKLVTFSVTEEIYLNGAHGMHYGFGQTFRKSDGRRFNSDMMCNIEGEDWHNLVKEGLRQYFSEMSEEGDSIGDEELKEYIISDDDINYLPMPQGAPYVSKQGVVFAYQPYEISFYAAGMPAFVVSLDDMKPYLTYTAKQLLY